MTITFIMTENLDDLGSQNKMNFQSQIQKRKEIVIDINERTVIYSTIGKMLFLIF